jgi:hypothetical protein
MSHPLRCRCGTVRRHVDADPSPSRAICYCRDCQAYARFLGRPGEVLDGLGGTDILATLPRAVHLTDGADRLACMSLSDKGLLRWYADCCRAPIGNTPRDPKVSYLGLVSSCLGTPAALDAAFGPAQVVINTDSALGPVKKTPVAMVFSILKIMRNVLGARLSGRYKENPFFKPGSSTPVVEPRNLLPAERDALRPEGG